MVRTDASLVKLSSPSSPLSVWHLLRPINWKALCSQRRTALHFHRVISCSNDVIGQAESGLISLIGTSEPVKQFERTANLNGNQIINYRCDPSEKWLVLIGIAPGAPEVKRPHHFLMSLGVGLEAMGAGAASASPPESAV